MKVEILNRYLEGYNQEIREYLVQGFTRGFSLECKGEVGKKDTKNLNSTKQHSEVVEEKINKEVKLGRYAGPFLQPPIENLTISPIGVHPKKAEGEYRLITNLSHPRGGSVNDLIEDEDATVQYANITSAIKLMKTEGKGCFMAKTDIKSAFRIIPLNADQYKHTGLKFNGKYYVDLCLPQGARSSCKIFETFSTAVEWIAKQKLGIKNILHILDDYMMISKSKEECLNNLKTFLKFCSDAGIPIANDKTLGPFNIIEFAGIELNSLDMTARLPEDKVVKCLKMIEVIYNKKTCTLKEVQKLTGTLNFACCVIYSGRAFLRRLYNLTIGRKNMRARRAVTKEIREDLDVWKRFLGNFNGYNMFMPEKWLSQKTVSLYTDSAKTKGFGAMMGKEWMYGEWEEREKEMDITVLEFYPIVLALKVWGQKLGHLNINIHTDNYALVHIINNQTVKNNEYCLRLLRIFVMLCMEYSILIRAHHIPGKENTLCDLLSRLQVSEFLSLAEYANREPVEIPRGMNLKNMIGI